MKELEERIKNEGIIQGKDIIKVGSFLNQQVDTDLLKKMVKEVKNHFQTKITKVLTIEASGLPFACAVAMEYGIPFIFAKKEKTPNLSKDLVCASVYSFTHKSMNTIFISKDYINKDDNILICDDFLANGEALNALIKIVYQCGASVVGCAVQIEKAFQNGGKALREKGYDVFSLASIKSINNKTIEFNI